MHAFPDVHINKLVCFCVGLAGMVLLCTNSFLCFKYHDFSSVLNYSYFLIIFVGL